MKRIDIILHPLQIILCEDGNDIAALDLDAASAEQLIAALQRELAVGAKDPDHFEVEISLRPLNASGEAAKRRESFTLSARDAERVIAVLKKRIAA